MRVYAVVFMDAIHYHVRSEGRIVKRAVYIALGIDMNGKKDVLGMYVGENESVKFWLSIMNGLKNRKVNSDSNTDNTDKKNENTNTDQKSDSTTDNTNSSNSNNSNNNPSATREFDTLKSKKVPQSLDIGLFFCQIFIFII